MKILIALGRKIRNFIKCFDKRTKKDCIKVFFYTAYFRAFILFVPFNKLRKRMGQVKSESPKEVEIDIYKEAKRIAWIVNKVSKYTPWESKCLVQALTAQKMLKKQEISTTIYLGVRKDENGKMIAHAWTRCGEFYVTGGANRNGFAVVAKFAS